MVGIPNGLPVTNRMSYNETKHIVRKTSHSSRNVEKLQNLRTAMCY